MNATHNTIVGKVIRVTEEAARQCLLASIGGLSGQRVCFEQTAKSARALRKWACCDIETWRKGVSGQLVDFAVEDEEAFKHTLCDWLSLANFLMDRANDYFRNSVYLTTPRVVSALRVDIQHVEQTLREWESPTPDIIPGLELDRVHAAIRELDEGGGHDLDDVVAELRAEGQAVK